MKVLFLPHKEHSTYPVQPTEQEAGWILQLPWIFLRTEKSPAAASNQTPDDATDSSVTVPLVLSTATHSYTVRQLHYSHLLILSFIFGIDILLIQLLKMILQTGQNMLEGKQMAANSTDYV